MTNHAISAMVEDQITHTRCTACEADHEYKEARVPSQRRKGDGSSMPKQPSARIVPHTEPEEEAAVLAALESVSVSVVIDDEPAGEAGDDNAGNREDDNWPVHRRLIRATFPRPEGQPPEWKEPEFTNRQPTHRRGRFGGHGQGEPNGNRAGQPRRGRGQFQGNGGQPRGDGNRSGGHFQGGGGRPGGGQGQPGQGNGEGGGGGRRRRRRGR